MALGNSKKATKGVGVFLVVGAILVSAARLAGLRPPASNTSIGQGGEFGYWIGTGIGILLGIALIAKGLKRTD